MKKRMLLLTLITLMMMVFTACSSNTVKDDSNKEVKIEETEGEDEEAEENEQEDESEVAETDEDDSSSDNEKFAFGVQENNVYENEFLGIGCELDDEWTFYTEEEIQELNNLTMDLYDSDAIDYVLENNMTVIDMMAMTDLGTKNINITLTDLEKVGFSDNKEAYLSMGISSMASLLEDAGAEDVEVIESEMEFIGETCTCVEVKQTMYGVEMHQLSVYFFRGNYAVNVVVTSTVEGEAKELLEAFYELD